MERLRHFPGLKKKYIETYGNAYELPSPDEKKLLQLMKSICGEHDMLCTPKECFDYMYQLPEKYRQMTFFDL